MKASFPIRVVLSGLLGFLLLFGLSCKEKRPDRLTVAVSANMQFTAEELTLEFTRRTGVQCDLISSSSGKLTAQIREGAPFDIFLSADVTYPETLFREGLTTSEPLVYAYGKLILLTVKEGTEPSLKALESSTVKHIALANPRTAPYGEAANQVLEKLGLSESLKDKLVYGESISQTNQFITSGAADLGFTCQSVVHTPDISKHGKWLELDPLLYEPIAQALVLIKGREEFREEAESLKDFILSSDGREILHKFGYLFIPE